MLVCVYTKASVKYVLLRFVLAFMSVFVVAFVFHLVFFSALRVDLHFC